MSAEKNNELKKPSTDHSAELLELKLLSPQVLGLRFAVDADYRWEPGQYLWLRWSDETGETRLPYSIASSQIGAGTLELAVSIGGLSAERLKELRNSEFNLSRIKNRAGRFEVSPAEGASIWNRLGREPQQIKSMSLIGIGTGVAPLRAAYQHFHHLAPEAQVHLLHGIRHKEDRLFVDEFEEQARSSSLSYLPTLTQAEQNWQGLRGRVQEHLKQIHHCDAFYICGSRAMTQEIRQLLLEGGVDSEAIVHEGF